MYYFIEFMVSFLLVALLMPILMKLSNKIGFTDKPTKRKKHNKVTPLCGGLAMFIVFFIVYYFVAKEDKNEAIWIFISSTLILLIGLIDDSYKAIGKEFPILPRLIIQILAAILVFNAGIAFKGFTNPFTGNYVTLNSFLQFVLSITWIFGVTTVINWSDGMDGLAGGISLVSSITFFIAAIILGQNYSATSSIVLAGVIAGFLLYNRYPAKVFMGDSGANFLGFILSIIALDGAFKQATVLSLLLPILALAVPIFDNIFVIFKRFNEGKPVYQADRSQMHFRLEEKGLNKPQVVHFIVGISIVCSFLSIVLLFYNHP
ncbi:UDP-N-acetylmuramyl pentapeptide phosphotransferase/UDP-N-acetylglucosamine-1-phosphate transferase [Clostridium moniliforme]|uniref:UDP-N-acetylmuramyl pentapeptide phosphotransferase/UDP-N-acetylglucosamine-1-phosphate transferase n=1 Tax=Clostridium moniliforme TaxID=39489 RepID=A0ABS4EY84_9CLOT|nr:MraY family glycosyltransferase [Clostridium moniliforme]MBP1888960.1 UDP-N-acetylmuramyl pentapeptide phosphotransferase/UDP-N-acetylglucosamine-1-phosphate transferase [Clostridium moniliforme]